MRHSVSDGPPLVLLDLIFSFRAGHSGRHVCETLPHLCGAPCDLSGRTGCMLSCTKVGSTFDIISFAHNG
jgi:hypothetical protein